MAPLFPSPDGRWLGYRAGVGTNSQILARHVDRPSEWTLVASLSGSVLPNVVGWGRRGIYYVEGTTVSEIPVELGPDRLTAQKPRRLFDASTQILSRTSQALITWSQTRQQFIALEAAADRSDEVVAMLNGA